MTYTIYRRIGEFPRCRHCKGLMDYWNPYQDEDTYSHPKCDAAEFGREIGKILKEAFDSIKKDEKSI